MPNRSGDWFAQAERDLEHARESRERGRHEWACFAAQQKDELSLLAAILQRVQHELFNLGSILATLPEDVHQRVVRITEPAVQRGAIN